jgi:hypothetical protein
MFELQDFVKDDINLIEIYLFNFHDENVVGVNVEDEVIEKIKKKYFNWKKCEYTVFHKDNMMYQYDRSSDNQIVCTKEMKNHVIDKNNIIITYKHSKLPTYLFACTDDIDDKLTYTIEECRVSNRISIVIKKDINATSVYIEYKHSLEAEHEKNQSILKNVLYNINNARF